MKRRANLTKQMVFAFNIHMKQIIHQESEQSFNKQNQKCKGDYPNLDI